MKPIPFAPNYLITEYGEVFNSVYRNGRTCKTLDTPKKLSPVKNRRGYLRIALWSDNKYRIWSVHQLVLLTFVGECPDKYECAHLDGDPSNNHVSNLKWTSRKENHSHKKIHGTMAEGERNAAHKLTTQQVIEIKDMFKQGVTNAEIAAIFGVSVTMIGYIKKGKWWKHVIP